MRRPGADKQIRIGHASGVLSVGAQAQQTENGWHISKVIISRSARRLMVGEVFPAPQTEESESSLGS